MVRQVEQGDAFDGLDGAAAPAHLSAQRMCGRGFGRMRGRWNALKVVVACALPFTAASCGNSGPPDFTLSLASGQTATATIAQGGTTNIQFQVAAVHGSTGSITLLLSGLPPKVGVAPGVATVGIGSPQTFVLSAASSAPVTTAPVTLTASGVSGNALSSSSITHTQTLTLTVTPAPVTP
jgi:hypothetical protein